MKWIFKGIKNWYMYRFTKLRKDMLTQYKKEIAAKVGCDFSCIQLHKVQGDYTYTGMELTTIDAISRLKPLTNFYIGTFTVIKMVMGKASLISSFKLYQLPHCCAYAMSCNVSIYPTYRGKGLGRILNNLRVEMAKQMGYSSILCTDVADNHPQREVLKKNGWSDVHSIRNRRTGNTVMLSVKTIDK